MASITAHNWWTWHEDRTKSAKLLTLVKSIPLFTAHIVPHAQSATGLKITLLRLMAHVEPTMSATSWQNRINVSPWFEWQTMISQSACADKTHLSFDPQFYPTVNNHFLLVNSCSQKRPSGLCMSFKENVPNPLALPHLLLDLMPMGRAFSFLATC